MVGQSGRSYRLLPGRWRVTAMIVFLGSAVGVVVLSLVYRDGTRPGRLDTILQDRLSAATAGVNVMMRTLVVLGDWQIVVALTVALALIAARMGGWYVAVFAASSPALAAVVSEFMLKPVVGRDSTETLRSPVAIRPVLPP